MLTLKNVLNLAGKLKNIKKAKGITKVVTKKEILHQNYRDAIFNKEAFKHGHASK